LLIEVSGLGSEAAAIALMAEKSTYETIQLLELGHRVIIGFLNDIRADISDLQDKYPRLAEEFIKLRDLLDASARQVAQSPAVTHQVKPTLWCGPETRAIAQRYLGLTWLQSISLSPVWDRSQGRCSLWANHRYQREWLPLWCIDRRVERT